MPFKRGFVVEVTVRGKPRDHKVRSPLYDTREEAAEQHALLSKAVQDGRATFVTDWLTLNLADMVVATVIPITTGSGSLQLG